MKRNGTFAKRKTFYEDHGKIQAELIWIATNDNGGSLILSYWDEIENSERLIFDW